MQRLLLILFALDLFLYVYHEEVVEFIALELIPCVDELAMNYLHSRGKEFTKREMKTDAEHKTTGTD